MILLLSHCSLVILRSALMDLDRGEKEYHAENEQPGELRIADEVSFQSSSRLINFHLTEGCPSEEEYSAVPVERVDDGEFLSLAV